MPHVRRRHHHHRRRRRRRLLLKWGNYKSWINGATSVAPQPTLGHSSFPTRPPLATTPLSSARRQSLRELAARCQDIRRRGLRVWRVSADAVAAAIAMLCQLKNLTSNGGTDTGCDRQEAHTHHVLARLIRVGATTRIVTIVCATLSSHRFPPHPGLPLLPSLFLSSWPVLNLILISNICLHPKRFIRI